MAEGVGFEPTGRLNTGQTISSRSRYDHFDTPANMSIPIISKILEKNKVRNRIEKQDRTSKNMNFNKTR